MHLDELVLRATPFNWAICVVISMVVGWAALRPRNYSLREVLFSCVGIGFVLLALFAGPGLVRVLFSPVPLYFLLGVPISRHVSDGPSIVAMSIMSVVTAFFGCLACVVGTLVWGATVVYF